MTELMRVQLLSAFALNRALVPGRRLKALGLVALVAVCLVPGYGGYVALLHQAFAFVASHRVPVEDLVLTGIYSTAQLTVVLVGVPVVYSTLFQARDLTILLPLPYRPVQILGAKVAVMYLVELLVGAALFLPALVLYVLFAHPGALVIANAVVALLLLPLIPLALTTLVSIGLVNVPGIGRSKWFWFLFMMIAVMGASMVYTTMTMMGTGPQALTLIQAKMAQLNQMGRLLPGAVFALRAMVAAGPESLGFQALNVLVAAGYVVALMAAGQWFYIGPILRGGNAGARRHRQAEPSQARSFLASYMRKELATTLKDPAVAMNAVGWYISIPLLAVTYTVLKIQSRGKVDVIGAMLTGLRSPEFRAYLPFVVVGFALALALFGSGSSLFSASYSKDGRRLWIEKTLPVTPLDVMLGKLAAGMLLVSVANLITIGLAALVVPFGWARWLYVIVLSEVAMVAAALVGLAIDCLRPKLVWKDTVQAVKQNVNVVLALGISMALIVANAALLYGCRRLGAPDLVIYAGLLVANVLFLAGTIAVARKCADALDRVVV